MKLYLVDGTYELFRSYFGAPPASAPDGRPIGAVRGLVQSLLLLLKDEAVTHVACAFDHVIESFRNDLFDGYKTGEGVPQDLLSQFDLAEEAVSALGITVWPMIEFEADDALATAASRYGSDDGLERVVICSPDKDLAQAVDGSRVVCLDRRRDIVLDEEGVWSKFGVGPESIPDYLGPGRRLGGRHPRHSRVGRQSELGTPCQVLPSGGHTLGPVSLGRGIGQRSGASRGEPVTASGRGGPV